MSNRLQKRFEDFEETPSVEIWSKIKSQIHKPRFNWLAFSTIAGAVILVSGITIMLLSPQKNILKPQIIAEKTNNLTNVTEDIQTTNNVNNTIVYENNINQVKTNSDNESKNNAGQPNSIIQTNNNHITKENNIQLKEAEKTSSNNIINSYIAYSNNNSVIKNNQSIQEEEIIQDKVSEVINDDTISSRRELFIPNAFTPNLSENNIFKPAYTKVKSYEMMIFNRNGVLLFTSKDIRIGWNGYFKGRLCDLGAYVYYIKFENMKGQSFGQRGIVNLIR